jgi:hypothetical protein
MLARRRKNRQAAAAAAAFGTSDSSAPTSPRTPRRRGRSSSIPPPALRSAGQGPASIPAPGAFASPAPAPMRRAMLLEEAGFGGADGRREVEGRVQEGVVRIVWKGRAERPPVVAAGFDGWLHHRMIKVAGAGVKAGKDAENEYVVRLRVPTGEQGEGANAGANPDASANHSVLIEYKFLVDGSWSVDPSCRSGHPLSPDCKTHCVHRTHRSNAYNSVAGFEASAFVTDAKTTDSDTASAERAVVATSASTATPGAPTALVASMLQSQLQPQLQIHSRTSYRGDLPRGASFTDAVRARCGVVNRQSRRMATAASDYSSLSQTISDTAADPSTKSNSDSHNQNPSAARRSVMMRVGGARWLARLAAHQDRTDSASGTVASSPEAERLVELMPSVSAPDIGHNIRLGFQASGDRGSKRFPASPPVPIDKENSSYPVGPDRVSAADMPYGFGKAKLASPNSNYSTFLSVASTKRRQSRRTASSTLSASSAATHEGPNLSSIQSPSSSNRPTNLRSSTRAMQKVVISMPTRVDEPTNADDVHRTAQNWRDMARHLLDDLKDPVGARQLLHQAIEHREKHGLWSTFENAQVHIDLARSLSKADGLADTEFHLRIALRIYEQVNAAPEHMGDLIHYIAVVVDRQKKRVEAEKLYRDALRIYKEHRLTGDNVDIALKNLSLNLKKQNRMAEAGPMLRDFYCSLPSTSAHGIDADPEATDAEEEVPATHRTGIRAFVR